MGYVVKELISLIKKQLGYTETGVNRTKYSRFFDVEAWQFFNTKKNGTSKSAGAPWCAIYVIWAIVQVIYPLLGKSYDACRKWLGMPAPKYNEAAGCKQFYGYLKAKKWEVAKDKGQAGDIIFLNTKSAKCGHVGLIQSVENGKYITNEGNKGNKVANGTYSFNSSTIYAIIHPDYESLEPKEEPKQDPVQDATTAPEPVTPPVADIKPEPAPEPAPVLKNVKYVVSTISGQPLALRAGRSRSSKLVMWMKQGTTIEVDKTEKGEPVYGSSNWAHAYCNGKSGWCTATRIHKK